MVGQKKQKLLLLIGKYIGDKKSKHENAARSAKNVWEGKTIAIRKGVGIKQHGHGTSLVI